MSEVEEPQQSMKPLLAACVEEATLQALVDVSMWTGEVPGQQIRDAPVMERYRLLGPVDALVEPGPATLSELARVNEIELMSCEARRARGGWVEETSDRMAGYVSFHIEGDDRWWFSIPLDAPVRVERYPTDEEREAWRHDPYLIPANDFDCVALARNISLRLFGPGGWMLPGPLGGYTPNMSTREVFEASFTRPDRNHTAEIAATLKGAIGDQP